MSKHDTRAKTLSDRLDRLIKKKRQTEELIQNTLQLIVQDKKRAETLKDRVSISKLVIKTYNSIHPDNPVTEFMMQAMLSNEVVQAVKDKITGTYIEEDMIVMISQGKIVSIK